MPLVIAAVVATMFVAIAYGIPDESGFISLVVIPLAMVAIFGSAMTYSRLRGNGDSPGADRFLGAIAATFVLFVAGAASALALDATSTPVWLCVALLVVAPVAATTRINARSRRTPGERTPERG